jgi:hypothetical protein
MNVWTSCGETILHGYSEYILPENKTGLIRFLGDYALKHYTCFTLGDNDQIQLAGCFQNPEIVMTISSGPIDDVTELFSTQEKADTRIILHALFAKTCVMFQGVVTKKPNKTSFVFGNRKTCFQSGMGGMGLLSII